MSESEDLTENDLKDLIERSKKMFPKMHEKAKMHRIEDPEKWADELTDELPKSDHPIPEGVFSQAVKNKIGFSPDFGAKYQELYGTNGVQIQTIKVDGKLRMFVNDPFGELEQINVCLRGDSIMRLPLKRAPRKKKS